MSRALDWEALGQLQFLLMRRLTEPLNAGLAAVSLVHLEEAADKPREYWQERATGEIFGVLNLVNAWHALIRYKLGELLPHQHIRPFEVQGLLDWLSYQLELVSPLNVEDNLVLESSQEAMQEALLLLYSAAYTLGPSVHLVVQSTGAGVWFRVRYARRGNAPCPKTLDDLMDRLSGNWRLEDTSMELRLAADFVALSGSQLHLQGTEHFCEMAFFVYAVGQRPPDPRTSREVTEPPPIATSESEKILIAMAAGELEDEDSTRPLPSPEIEEMIDETLKQVFGEEALPVLNRARGTQQLSPLPDHAPDAVAGQEAQMGSALAVLDDEEEEVPTKPIRPDNFPTEEELAAMAETEAMVIPPLPPDNEGVILSSSGSSLVDTVFLRLTDDTTEEDIEQVKRPRIVWAKALRHVQPENEAEGSDTPSERDEAHR